MSTKKVIRNVILCAAVGAVIGVAVTFINNFTGFEIESWLAVAIVIGASGGAIFWKEHYGEEKDKTKSD